MDRDSWCTPNELLTLVRAVDARIALDPCGCEGDRVGAEVSIRRPDDGLSVPWSGLGADGLVFINPPYSAPAPWVEKAVAEADRAVLLLPANPDTRWFHRLARSGALVCLLEGRYAFERGGEPAKGNRQGSVLALVSPLDDDWRRAQEAWEMKGVFVEVWR